MGNMKHTHTHQRQTHHMHTQTHTHAHTHIRDSCNSMLVLLSLNTGLHCLTSKRMQLNIFSYLLSGKRFRRTEEKRLEEEYGRERGGGTKTKGRERENGGGRERGMMK